MEQEGRVAVVSRRSVLAASAATPLLPLARPGRALAALSFTTETNVVYGTVDGEELLLDVYSPPDRAEPGPAVVVLHSGAWTSGVADRTARTMKIAAENLAGAGYVAFNADYRLTTIPRRFFWPDQLDDVQRVVRWVRANAAAYNVDPERIGAYGHSAGAHLASMLGVRDTNDDSDPALAGISSRVSCVVALAGHFDLTIPYLKCFDEESVKRLLDERAAPDPASYRDASPLTWVDGNSAPFLIIHGLNDDLNPLDHPRRMIAALRAAGVEVNYAELPGVNHFNVADWDRTGTRTLSFFDAHLNPDG
jgi:acetyl esterase/lipase